MTVLPIAPVGATEEVAQALAPMQPTQGPAGAFARMLMDGVDQVNQSVIEADRMVQAFAVDDSIPLHHVTFALEQARLSTELMMQVRSRLLEGYQEIMRMQL